MMDTTKGWKPHLIITGILAVITALFAFLYVNKAKWFIFYLFLIIPVALSQWFFDLNLKYLYVLACLLHALFIAHRYNTAQQRYPYSRWWAIVSLLLIFIVTVALIRLFLFEPFKIPSSSMNPGIKAGDYIIVNKLGFGAYSAFGFSLGKTKPSQDMQLHRGGLYVFFIPGRKEDIIYVKRLIALPGDHISIQDDRILLNDQYLPQSVTSENGQTIIMEEYSEHTQYPIQILQERPPIKSQSTDLTIPQDHYFFMGDNRRNSLDSRIMGPIPADHLIGEVVHVFQQD